MKAIQVLVLEGCPNIDAALENIRAAIASTKVSADIDIVRIESVEAAVRLRFLGSPTVRVDGIDVESAAEARGDFGMQCRVYAVGGRFSGTPPVAWIAAALAGEIRS